MRRFPTRGPRAAATLSAASDSAVTAPVAGATGFAPRRLGTVREAAQIAAVSPRSIWAAIARGDLVAVRLGARTTRIELASIEAWIERAKSRSAQ